MTLTLTVPDGFSLVADHEWGMDVDLENGSPDPWQPLRLLTTMTPTPTQRTRPEETMDDDGNPNQGVIGVGYGLAATNRLALNTGTGLALPEYELLDAKAAGRGSANVAHVRWYHKPKFGTAPRPIAREAYVSVAAAPPTTGTTGNTSDVTYTLTTKGAIEEIVNPFTPGATAPAISGVTPAGAGEDDQVLISGGGFTGTTGVTFDAIAATSFLVVSDSQLSVVLPADTAGVVPVIVTNAAGPSDAFPYTRGV